MENEAPYVSSPLDDLLAQIAERRARMTPEERAAADAHNAQMSERDARSKAWWAECAEGVADPDSPEGQWAVKVRAFERLAFHDFFTGPGPLDVYTDRATTSLFESSYDISTEAGFTPHEDPCARVLAEAIRAAGLTGKMRLTAVKYRRSTGTEYVHYDVSFLDWNLLPHICQQAWLKDRMKPSLWAPEERRMHHGLLDIAPSGERTLWDVVRLVVGDEGHPLAPALLAAMAKKEHFTVIERLSGCVPTWPAWSRLRARPSGFCETTPRYDEIPTYPARYMAVNRQWSVDRLLRDGIVVQWPLSDRRVQIRVNPTMRGFRPSNWQYEVFGAPLLRIEFTDAPLSKTTDTQPKIGDPRPGWPSQTVANVLQVFGQGRSQQDARVPTVPGRTTFALLSWTEESDFTVTIMVTVDEAGRPLYAWVDGSGT